MGQSDVKLEEYDIVLAVTQDSINESLAEFLAALDKNVALYYDVDSQGNYVPAPSKDAAQYIFEGVLGYQTDSQGNPIDIVKLYTDAGYQHVNYNITFASAEFQSTVPPLFDDKQTPGSPWVIQFSVDLKAAAVQLDQIPASAQATIKKALGELDPTMFSIQQLYADLNTASYDQMASNIPNMTSFAESIFAGNMTSYMATLQASSQLIFGYTVSPTPAYTQPPTLMPTALDFSVSPYTDGEGNHSQPGLDTLNYLVMTANHARPSSPPTTWAFNWVDDSSVQGVVAVRHDLYLPILINALAPILMPLSPTLYVKADGSKNIDSQTMQLNPCNGQPAFTLTGVSTGVVATYAYNPKEASDTDPYVGGEIGVTLDYSSVCSVSLAGSTVSLSGSVTVSTDVNASVGRGDEDLNMPPTTWAWSADLVLQINLTANGQLQFAVENASFGSAPTVAPEHQSAWDKFWSNVGGSYQEFASNLGGVRDTVQTNVVNAIAPALAQIVNSPNQFVFPGASTFVFESPAFSGAGDLTAEVTYLTPTAAVGARG